MRKFLKKKEKEEETRRKEIEERGRGRRESALSSSRKFINQTNLLLLPMLTM